MNSLGKTRPRLYKALKVLWKVRMGVFGAMIVCFVCALAIFAPYVAPYSPYEGDITKRLMPPSWAEKGDTAHILGTDHVGRDLLSRIIFGSRVSLVVGSVSVLIATTIGVLLGLIAGYHGKIWDWIISSMVNIMISSGISKGPRP